MKVSVPVAPTVSCDGPVVSFGVFGQGVGSEPLAAPGPPNAPTLPLPGGPHSRSGTPTRAQAQPFFQMLQRVGPDA